MAKKKLLYVCPHLSTGGQPQYTYKQIKHFINDFEIEVVEINNSGGNAFVVQKNRIKSLVPVHTLGENKKEIDLVIFVTQTPDYPVPNNAIIFQDKLGLKKDSMCFDVPLGCSGYVYGLSIIYSPLGL